MTDFFISYTGVDRPWAEWIAWQLEAAGYTTVIQAWDFRPGGNFVVDMQQAATTSERTIAVLSPAYLQSGFTAAEWASAFASDPTGTQGLLLPVRIRDCELRGLLRPIIYIDLMGLEDEAARERLLAGVLRQRMKPTRPPGFPGHTSGSIAAPPLFPGSIPQTISLLGAAFIPGGASKFRGQIEAFLEVYLVTETRTGTVPFGGRDEDLALLDTWLDDETAPPRYLLTAPAGRGKSTLLVHWLQHLLEQGRVGPDSPVSWQLVFVPISIRFETHRPDIFFEAIATRLAEILGIALQPTQMDKASYYANHCRELASAAIAQGRRILIVLDGIDEALGERFDVYWFPRNAETSLRLVLSARWQVGDLDSSGWKTRLEWDRDVRVQSRELPVLAREGVRDLLLKMGAPTDVLASRPDIVDRLHGLAEGEPLVLRYYAEDIWSMGEAAPRLTIDDLSQMRPGFGAYFKRWLDDQERLWTRTNASVDRQRVDAILAILACAHGRLTGTDLRALLTEGGETVVGGRFLEQLKPIQRFVIGLDRPEAEAAGYILSHPKLDIYLCEEYFDPDQIQVTQAAFVRWGQKTIARLNSGMLRPEETPAYLVQYHTQHLQDVAAPAEAFFELVEQGWLHAWERFEGGYRGFSRDMRLAYEALSRAHTTEQPRFAQRLRCQVVRGSIYSIGAIIPWELLVAAFNAGVLTYRQVAHWLEFQPFFERACALGKLAPHRLAQLGAEVLSEVLTAARSIEYSDVRADVLGELAPHLPVEVRAEVLLEALTAARSIKDSSSRARALGELTPHLPVEVRAEVLLEALTVARLIEYGSNRARVLGELAPHLPVEVRAEVLLEALTAARSIEDSSDRVYALGELAPHLPAELLSEALTAARSIENSASRAHALGELAPHLPVEVRAEVLSEALTVARSIEDSSSRAYVLGELAPHLPVEVRAEVLSEALSAARSIENSVSRARALWELMLHLPVEVRAEVLSEALSAARSIEDSSSRAYVLGELVLHLPAELLSEALTVTRSIEDSLSRVDTLRELAPHLPAELLPEALTMARSVVDSVSRTHALRKLAPHLPVEVRAEVLSEALSAARLIEYSDIRARAFGELAPHLPVELGAKVLSEALTAAQSIENSSARLRTLGELAPHLPTELLSEALTAARSIKDSSSRARALGELAPHLPTELLSEVLTAARSIKDSSGRARALGELVPHLPVEVRAEVLLEALTAARSIKDSSSRARTLGELVPHLPVEVRAEVLLEALTAARSIKDSSSRARALGELAPHLPVEVRAEVLLEALTVARLIEYGSNRARVLGELVLHLPVSEALTVARSIEDSSAHARVLGKLAPQLSGNLLQQGFEELLDVLPRCYRHSSLSAVSSFFPFLEECQGPKGLEEVRRAIVDTARWFP